LGVRRMVEDKESRLLRAFTGPHHLTLKQSWGRDVVYAFYIRRARRAPRTAVRPVVGIWPRSAKAALLEVLEEPVPVVLEPEPPFKVVGSVV